jgi:hypothetical protein
MHLHTTFQTLNNLKEKQIRTKTTLENLTTHKTDGTLPNNLNKTMDCHIILDKDLRKCWVQTSRDAAYKQLDILLEQQKRKLTNIETKITHATERIRDNITDTTKTTEILNKHILPLQKTLCQYRHILHSTLRETYIHPNKTWQHITLTL